MALITNTNPLLADLNYNNLSTAQKAQVDALLNVATEFIEKDCNRTFLAATYTDEEHNGVIHESIFVKNTPLNSVTNVKIICHASTESSDDITTYLSTEVLFEPETGEIKLRNGARFPHGFRNVKITYNGGFTTVPKPIEYLCANIVINAYAPEMNAENIEKERIGDYFYAKVKDFMEKLPMSDRKILSMYRLRKP